jgi:DNA-binding NarL/FixJ family response regulator
MSKTIRVLLADDHPALRAGIRAILEKAPDVQVVGEAEDGTEAQQLTADLRPQVLLWPGCGRAARRRPCWC